MISYVVFNLPLKMEEISTYNDINLSWSTANRESRKKKTGLKGSVVTSFLLRIIFFCSSLLVTFIFSQLCFQCGSFVFKNRQVFQFDSCKAHTSLSSSCLDQFTSCFVHSSTIQYQINVLFPIWVVAATSFWTYIIYLGCPGLLLYLPFL